MTEADFINKNESYWHKLEEYNECLTAVGGVKHLTMRETQDFARLFRLAGYHLAYAKTHYANGQSLLYLNRIVGIAHNHFYIREKSGWKDIKQYFLHGFPKAVREYRYYIGMATAFFLFGVFFAALYVMLDISRFYHIFPQGFGEGNALDSWDHSLMSAVIMTNNISVAVTAFGFGILAGAGTVFILVYNGIIVGGLYGFLAATNGDMLNFFSLILPHGVLELTAIFLCGGCGLMLGRGILIPGKYTRKHSLVFQAKRAVKLIPGIIVMLVIAAFIEGFFTPLPIAPGFKLAFAAMTAVGLAVYFLRIRKYS
jgi:uncharacterized membrane protein SpoIIM required for sporulation